MTNDLLEPDDLLGFPGAPFAEGVVDAAVAGLRAHAGWHIAGERTETLTLDSEGGVTLMLPTLHVADVTEVRDVSGDTASPVASYRWSAVGMLSGCWWPRGFRTVEVDLTHGYTECPPELLPVIATACQTLDLSPALAAKSVGPFSESYRDLTAVGGIFGADPAVRRYTLPSRP